MVLTEEVVLRSVVGTGRRTGDNCVPAVNRIRHQCNRLSYYEEFEQD